MNSNHALKISYNLVSINDECNHVNRIKMKPTEGLCKTPDIQLAAQLSRLINAIQANKKNYPRIRKNRIRLTTEMVVRRSYGSERKTNTKGGVL